MAFGVQRYNNFFKYDKFLVFNMFYALKGCKIHFDRDSLTAANSLYFFGNFPKSHLFVNSFLVRMMVRA